MVSIVLNAFLFRYLGELFHDAFILGVKPI